MTTVDPAVPVSEPGAKGLREAVERVRRFLDERERPTPFAPQGFLPVDFLGEITRTGDRLLASDLRALLAVHTPEGAEGERVHWVGEHNNTLHGNGAGSKDMERTSGDEDEVTCKLCLSLLAREDVRERISPAEPDAGDVAALAEAVGRRAG